jgi:hypothetical protein
VAEATTTITNATLAATLKIRSMPLSKDIATALGIPPSGKSPSSTPHTSSLRRTACQASSRR